MANSEPLKLLSICQQNRLQKINKLNPKSHAVHVIW